MFENNANDRQVGHEAAVFLANVVKAHATQIQQT